MSSHSIHTIPLAPARSLDPATKNNVEHEPNECREQGSDVALSRSARDKDLLHTSHESALDPSKNASASLLDLPTLLTSERMRRRSDISRVRPRESSPVVESEAIELPIISKHAQASSSAVCDPAITFREDATIAPIKTASGDPGIAPSFPNSLVPSIYAAEAVETSSTTPAISAAQKAVYERRSWMHFLALCWCVFCNGWNDGTTGPLLPRIQEHYHVGCAVVSMLFVCNTIGFISGAFANIYLTDKFGFGKVLVAGSALQIVAYTIIGPAVPFPLIYVASLKRHARTKMGFLHGSYGLGGFVSPLAATQFAKSPTHWSFHYIISAGLYVSNMLVLWTVFRGRAQQDIMEAEGESGMNENAVDTNKFKQVLGLKEVHVLSAFSLIYVGLKVTLGGWSVTYILDMRNGSSSAGYIASGFFGGLMLGRVLLLWLNKKLGERRALFLYALLAIVYVR
ncbi:major facilitator superfamily domain-containing protein [Cubamyces lactineus]|nr:major facilitator superfamily domain-containing protein [Cubamyces lactineus]